MRETWQSHDPLFLLACFVLAVVAVGRAARLVTHDDFPPAAAARNWWLIHAGKWGNLLDCPFCFAPYAAAVDLAWALWSGLDWHHFWGAAWLVVNLWAALSYLAAIAVAYDGDDSDAG